MASRTMRDHAQLMVEFILLVVTGLACLVLLADVPLGYIEARREERERRVH